MVPSSNGSLRDGEHKANMIELAPMDEGRKRVVGIMAAILASLHMQTADDLFGGPQGSPRSDKLDFHVEEKSEWQFEEQEWETTG